MIKVLIPLFIAILLLRFITLEKVDLKTGQHLEFTSRLMSEPTVKAGKESFQLFYKGNRINVTTINGNNYHYGELLNINGKVQTRLLNNKNELIYVNFPKIEAREDKLAVAYKLRQSIISVFEKTLPSNYSALLLGIVFGIKSSLSSSLLSNLKVLGLMHVIAASGMNVTIVAGFLSSIFLLIFKRQVALALTILGIILYAFLAGFEPSIVRASIMGLITFSAQILGRQKLASYSLAATAYIMIMFSPYVVWDIGFQLSFAATAGLIFVRPVLYQFKILKKFFKIIIVGEDVSTTIAAQVATLPIMLANFGLYSALSVVVNAFVLWTIPFLMIIGGLGFFATIILQPLGNFVMYLSIPFLFYFEAVVNLFSGFSSPVSTASFPIVFIGGYYLILTSIIWVAYLKKNG